MDGRYNVGIEHIRALAITCLALDGQFDPLFNSESICGHSPRITDSYERLSSVSLLNLAVSIRVSLSGEPEYNKENSGVEACGVFETGAPKENGGFTLKDVCDKIIHATKIFKPIEHGVVGACSRLSGHYNVSGDINPLDSEDRREAPPESFTVLSARTTVFGFDAGVSSAVV